MRRETGQEVLKNMYLVRIRSDYSGILSAVCILCVL